MSEDCKRTIEAMRDLVEGYDKLVAEEKELTSIITSMDQKIDKALKLMESNTEDIDSPDQGYTNIFIKINKYEGRPQESYHLNVDVARMVKKTLNQQLDMLKLLKEEY